MNEGHDSMDSMVDVYSYAILVLAIIGVFVNLASLVLLIRKRSCSMFHNLLKVGIQYRK